MIKDIISKHNLNELFSVPRLYMGPVVRCVCSNIHLTIYHRIKAAHYWTQDYLFAFINRENKRNN